MNKLKLICAISCLVALITACEKELMTYEGKDSLYFDIRNEVAWLDPDTWSHEHFSAVSFGSTMQNDLELNLKVQASGMPSNIDREFEVIVVKDSTELQDGDFDGLESFYVIKAGETSTTINLTFHRKEYMTNDTLQLQLALVENKYFSLMYSDFGKAPEQYDYTKNPKFDYNHNASIHNIFVYDVMSKPNQWLGGANNSGLGVLGNFSAKKWKLMMELSGTVIDDWSSALTMPNSRMQGIGEILAVYLLEKARAKDPVLDEDGTMMYCSAISSLGGSDAWSPFTKPEDYYK